MATGHGAQRATIADRGGPNVNPGQIKVNKKVRFDFIFKSYETGVKFLGVSDKKYEYFANRKNQV
jgi:hypothetical protein